MLLVLDIGNSNIVAGVFAGDKLVADWRLATDRQKTADEYGILLRSLLRDRQLESTAIDAVALSSVVPPLTGPMEEMAAAYFSSRVLTVGPGIKTGLAIKLENTREVGADRVVNAVAALKIYGAPLVIVDFGTATTFCAVAPNGDYLGGAIAPGLGIAGEALFQRTAKLPRVEVLRPKTAIGKNTVNSIQSGLFFGYIGLTESLITRIKAEIGGDPKVVATGGWARKIAAETRLIDHVNPNLTLEGLRLIYELNQLNAC